MAEKQKNQKWIMIPFAVNFCMTMTTLYLVGVMFYAGLYKTNTSCAATTADQPSAQTQKPLINISAAPSEEAVSHEPSAIPQPVVEQVGDGGFVTKDIMVDPGRDLTVVVENTGSKAHSFIIDALGVNSGDIDAGQTKSVKVGSMSQPGAIYDFYSGASGDSKTDFSGVISVNAQ